MKSLFFITVLSFFSMNIISCASKKNAKTVVVENNTQEQPSNPSDSLFASVEHGYCYGRCPVYSLKIYKSGYALYEGKANVEMFGLYSTKFSKEQLNTLTKVANEINYASLEDKYDGAVTDIPSHTTSIVLNGKRKQVMRRYNFPQSIVTFENQFDELIKDAKWNLIEAYKDPNKR
ncbi:MAG: DUF6438 domain-containing protein [Crocinitomicaceae bacterium]|nr:DUF6438 domain-containing protein [Crocinitomicaceae bacterium]